MRGRGTRGWAETGSILRGMTRAPEALSGAHPRSAFRIEVVPQHTETPKGSCQLLAVPVQTISKSTDVILRPGMAVPKNPSRQTYQPTIRLQSLVALRRPSAQYSV